MKNYVDDLNEGSNPDDYEEMTTTPWGKKSSFSAGFSGRCYESHPGLKIGEFTVYGGNSGSPIVLDADIYVSLQAGQYVSVPQPWHTNKKQVTQIMYAITDQSVPKDTADFKLLVIWLCNQLQAGKKIHIGCIGGHGRTGMVLAAMVGVLMPDEKSPIGYVRKNYCKKAVESSSQVAFLRKHYGAEEIAPRHVESSGHKHGSTKGKWTSSTPSHQTVPKGGWGASAAPAATSVRFANSKRQIDPVPSARNIFVEAK